MFEALYNSPWLATFAVAVVSVLGLALWARRQTFLVAYVALFTVETLGDALRSGSWSPLAGTRWEDIVGLGFVLAGDYRYFLLVERFAEAPSAKPDEATTAKAWLRALLWTMIVPIACFGLMRAAPTFFVGRWNYLSWELQFLPLVFVLRRSVFARRLAAAPAAVRRWLDEVGKLELATYALWALADVLVFAGTDAGFALRLVPNVMYYGLFVPFVAFRAPVEVRG